MRMRVICVESNAAIFKGPNVLLIYWAQSNDVIHGFVPNVQRSRNAARALHSKALSCVPHGRLEWLEPDSGMDFQRRETADLRIFSAVARLKRFDSRALLRSNASKIVQVAGAQGFRYEANYFGSNAAQHQR
jgi:hypothetical protein